MINPESNQLSPLGAVLIFARIPPQESAILSREWGINPAGEIIYKGLLGFANPFDAERYMSFEGALAILYDEYEKSRNTLPFVYQHKFFLSIKEVKRDPIESIQVCKITNENLSDTITKRMRIYKSELVLAIEKMFDQSFKDEEIIDMKNAEELKTYIYENLLEPIIIGQEYNQEDLGTLGYKADLFHMASFYRQLYLLKPLIDVLGIPNNANFEGHVHLALDYITARVAEDFHTADKITKMLAEAKNVNNRGSV